MISIGPYKLEHEAFIQDSWHESYRRAAKECTRLTDEQYHAWMRHRIDTLLARNPVILVATKQFPECELAVGWIVAEPVPSKFSEVIHYLYVKRNHRLEGIARALMHASSEHALSLYPDDMLGRVSTTHHYNRQKLGQPRGILYLDVQEVLHSAA